MKAKHINRIIDWHKKDKNCFSQYTATCVCKLGQKCQRFTNLKHQPKQEAQVNDTQAQSDH